MMNKPAIIISFFFTVFPFLSIFGQSSGIDKNFRIEGRFINAANPRMEYIMVGPDSVHHGYALLDNGRFVIAGKVKEPEIITLKTAASKDKAVEYRFYAEPDSAIYFSAAWGKPAYTITHSSIENDKIRWHNTRLPFEQKISYLDQVYPGKSGSSGREETASTREQLFDTLRMIDSLFILNNSQSYYAALLLNKYIKVPTLSFKFNSLISIYDSYPQWIKNTSTGRELRSQIELENLLNTIAPDFAIRDSNKNIRSLSQFRNSKLVLLCFTATWCSPCIETEHELSSIYEDFKDKNLQIISIYGDTSLVEWQNHIKDIPWVTATGSKEVRAFTHEKASVFERYHIHLLPTLMLVDYNGKIVKIFRDHSLPILRNTINEFL